jgi:hypothetical protein
VVESQEQKERAPLSGLNLHFLSCLKCIVQLDQANVVNAVVADESEDSPSMMQERERDRSRASASTISGKVGPGGRP